MKRFLVIVIIIICVFGLKYSANAYYEKIEMGPGIILGGPMKFEGEHDYNEINRDPMGNVVGLEVFCDPHPTCICYKLSEDRKSLESDPDCLFNRNTTNPGVAVVVPILPI